MDSTFYHTQEYRGCELDSPIPCKRFDAWLGNAYYFWNNTVDAHKWGQDYKCRYPHFSFQICSAELDFTNCLDTVFNEDHYNLYLDIVEQAKIFFGINRILDPKFDQKDIAKITNFIFNGKRDQFAMGELFAIEEQIDIILFADTPLKEDSSYLRGMSYRKRIQAAVYNTQCINAFETMTVESCSR